MPSYSYIAVDTTGKEKKASVDADTYDKALTLIRREGMIPIEVKEVGALGKDFSISFGGKVKPRDLSVFCRQFVSMIGAGVTIIDALEMLSDQTENKKLANAIKETRGEVEKGHTLSEAMGNHPEAFPSMFVNMVNAGETSGGIEIAVSRMGTQFEKSAKLKGLMTKSLMYPCVLMVVAVAILVIMLVKVIPGYATTFEQAGMDLPGVTMAMLAMSDFIKSYWVIIVGVLIGVIVFLRKFGKTDYGATVFGKMAIKIPLFGKLNMKTYSSQFARTLSTMMYAGIPMIEAIETVAKTMKNILFRNQLLEAKEEVAKGMPLSEPLRYGELFPPMVVHMLAIGEETGDIEQMLENLADYYDEEVEMGTQTVMAAMEPIIIIIMALMVLLLVYSIMSPMMGMYDMLDSL